MIKKTCSQSYGIKRAALFLTTVLALRFGVYGGGVVTNCTQANLQAALAGGGTVLFGCSGTVVLTNTVLISVNTSLDASNSIVTISGGNAVRLFQISTNVTFQLKSLTLADGRVTGPDGASGPSPGPGGNASGAGLLNLGGVLIADWCIFTNHVSQAGNAGNPTYTNTANGGDSFGAVVCSLGGRLGLTNCIISGNASLGGEW
jgi:hypothetical protein